MAKRRSGSAPSAGSTLASPVASKAKTTVEQRLVELAEQLGRLVGTVQSQAAGLLDKDALSEQIVSVRDSATELLAQVRGAAPAGGNKAARGLDKAVGSHTPVAARSAGRGRSGGVVDAPGKKHRKPLPSDPDAVLADSQSAKMRTAMPMSKTPRRRGRG